MPAKNADNRGVFSNCFLQDITLPDYRPITEPHDDTLTRSEREVTARQWLNHLMQVFCEPVWAQPVFQEVLRILISIDGPPAVGKGTLIEWCEEHLGIKTFSTGLFYRAFTHWFLQRGLHKLKDDETKKAVLQKITVNAQWNDEVIILIIHETGKKEVKIPLVIDQLRTETISHHISAVAGMPEVTTLVDAAMTQLAQDARQAVVDGRDGVEKFQKQKIRRSQRVVQATRVEKRLRAQAQEKVSIQNEVLRYMFMVYLYASEDVLQERDLKRAQQIAQQKGIAWTEELTTTTIAAFHERLGADYDRPHGRVYRPAEAIASQREDGATGYDLVVDASKLTPLEVFVVFLASLRAHIFPGKQAESDLKMITTIFTEFI